MATSTFGALDQAIADYLEAHPEDIDEAAGTVVLMRGQTLFSFVSVGDVRYPNFGYPADNLEVGDQFVPLESFYSGGNAQVMTVEVLGAVRDLTIRSYSRRDWSAGISPPGLIDLHPVFPQGGPIRCQDIHYRDWGGAPRLTASHAVCVIRRVRGTQPVIPA